MTTFERSNFDFNTKMKILTISKMLFLNYFNYYRFDIGFSLSKLFWQSKLIIKTGYIL